MQVKEAGDGCEEVSGDTHPGDAVPSAAEAATTATIATAAAGTTVDVAVAS